MRVVAGKYRGKTLKSCADKRIRPTSGRIKETLFNILYSKGFCEGIAVLDLFSGSGALGIEALSRGAAKCVFADIDRESVALTKQNLKVAGAESAAEVYHADYKTAVQKLSGRKFDLILIDPPFKSRKESEIIALILKEGILAPNGVIVIEHGRENELKDLPEGISCETRVCGNTKLTFLTNNG